MKFSPLTTTILVDEYLDGYAEMYGWLVGLTAPEDVTQNIRFNQEQLALFGGPNRENNLDYSDGLLEILDQSENVVRRIRFTGAFPTSISELALSSAGSADEPITFTVEFDYLDFVLEPRSEDISPV